MESSNTRLEPEKSDNPGDSSCATTGDVKGRCKMNLPKSLISLILVVFYVILVSEFYDVAKSPDGARAASAWGGGRYGVS